MTTSAMLWTGRVLTGLFGLFMLGAPIAPKLLGLPVAELRPEFPAHGLPSSRATPRLPLP